MLSMSRFGCVDLVSFSAFCLFFVVCILKFVNCSDVESSLWMFGSFLITSRCVLGVLGVDMFLVCGVNLGVGWTLFVRDVCDVWLLFVVVFLYGVLFVFF